MIRVTNISHMITNAEGFIVSHHVTINGYRLYEGASKFYAERPPGILYLIHDPVENPHGVLRVEEIPDVVSDAPPAPEATEVPAEAPATAEATEAPPAPEAPQPDQPGAPPAPDPPEVPTPPAEEEAPDVVAQPEETAPELGDGDSEGAEAEGGGDESPEAAQAEDGEAADAEAPRRSADMTANDARNVIRQLPDAAAIDAFVGRDTRATVLAAAQQRKISLGVV